MKMFLKNRININYLLPQSGSIIDQMTSRDIIKKVELDDAEKEKVEFKIIGNDRVIWNPEKDEGKEVEFSKVEVQFLKDQVDKLDREKQITSDLLELCLLIKDIKS